MNFYLYSAASLNTWWTSSTASALTWKIGASIALAATLLILPGFISDGVGFLLIIPFTRKIIINYWLKKSYKKKTNVNKDIIDGDIVDEKIKKDEL